MFEGSIILLNGASSSGKSSIVVQLQKMLSEPFLHVSIDRNFDTFPHHCWHFDEMEDIEIDRFIAGYNNCVATLAQHGNRVIFDTVFTDRVDIDECGKMFAPYKVFYIHVKCSLAVLEEREMKRGDRMPGLSASQVHHIANCGPFDFEVDTTEQTSEACAEQIVDFICESIKAKSVLSYNNSHHSQP